MRSHPLKPVLVTPPAADKPLVSLAEAKEQCRVEHGDHDSMIEGLIRSAVADLDGYSGILGRALVMQTWKQDYSCWPVGGARFPLAPAIVIDSVQYYDRGNALQMLDPSNFQQIEDALSPIVKWRPDAQLPALYDRPDAVQVIMIVGYGEEPAAVPENIRQAIKFMVQDAYDGNDDHKDTIDRLLSKYSRVGL